jgi:hypothetical protein
MKKNLKAFGNMINMRQILIGLTVLLLGTLVYLIDRSPDHLNGQMLLTHNTRSSIFLS